MGDDRVYRGLAVSTWDTWRNDTDDWPDRTFYRGVVARFGEPVLDLACATGRLVLDLLADGIDVEGLDASPAMLAVVRAKAAARGLPAPTLHHQGMEAVSLPRRYRTILASSSALQLLTGPGEAEAALARLVDHLEPCGAVVGSFDFGWEEGEPLDSGWVLLFERERDEGERIRSWTRERHHPDRQVWDAEQRFEVVLDGITIATERHHRTPEGRWYTQAQAVDLHRSAGLVDIEVTSEFSTDPATADDRLFCVLGVRPAGA